MKLKNNSTLLFVFLFITAGLFFKLLPSDINEIVISHNDNNPPFKFTNDKNLPDGLLIDIWNLWSIETGIDVKFISSDFEETITSVSKGTADVNAGLFYTVEREKLLDFTIPILKVEYYFFVDKSVYKKDFKNSELKAFKIGVPEGFTADFVKKNFPDCSIQVFSDFPELYEACDQNEIKLFVSPKETLEFYLETSGKKKDYLILFSDPIFSQSYHGAVKKGSKELLAIVNAGLEKITERERSDLKKIWFGKIRKSHNFTENGKLEFSENEKVWLAENSEILIAGDPEWPPNSMYDTQGNYIGIIPELWALIEKKSGLDFKRTKSASWAHTIELLKNNEIDIIDCVSETPERKEFMDFSDVLFTSSVILVGREELGFVNGLDDIGNLTVAVQEGVSEIELLKRDHPGLELTYYNDIGKAYIDVSSGKIDLFLRHQSDFIFHKKEKMLTNLKIVGPTGYSRAYKIGVKKGNTELIRILNKAVAQITQQERNKIFEKWHGSEKYIIDYKLVWKIIISALIVLCIVFYWNRTLAKEIRLRKKIQDDLQIAMEKAESATRAKSEFLANMSHEIRTPMNAILGFADLMKKTPLTAVQETYLNTIKSGGSTLLNIINDILDLSKIEANKLDINYTFFDISSLIFDLSQFFNEKLRSKNIQLITSLDEKMPRVVYLDELRVRQIFFNLLGNAIKFTNKGQIKITSSFKERPNGNINLIISVSDTGIGIKQEDQLKIFNAFEQVSDSETVKKYQGTGLGLTITKKLTELMNGTISLQSETEKGSCFTIEFNDVQYDKKDNLKNNKKSYEDTFVKFNEAKILIADDIQSNRLLLVEFCKELGFETIEAADGREAVDNAKLHIPDMILLDMRMPVMDGYEAIKIIKSDPKLNKIPVIAVTASVMSSDKAKIELYKFDGYIRKPVSLDELTSEMKKFLKHEVISSKAISFESSEEEIIDGEELYDILSSEVLKKVEKAAESHNFSQIQDLAVNLKTLADKHSSRKLRLFASKLHDSVIKFDIESIKILLDNYDDLILNFKKDMESKNE